MLKQEFKINTYDLGVTQKKEFVNVMAVQPRVNLIKNDDGFYILEYNEYYKNFIETMLNITKDNLVDLLVFPEYSIPIEAHGLIADWSKNVECVVIAGSATIDGYNASTTFFRGKRHRTEKIRLSPLESPINIKSGERIYKIANSPIGKFAILICADLFEDDILSFVEEKLKDIDFVITIANHKKANDHYTPIYRIVQRFHQDENPVYSIYCNSIFQNCRGGGSSIFAMEYVE